MFRSKNYPAKNRPTLYKSALKEEVEETFLTKLPLCQKQSSAFTREKVDL